MASRPKLLLIDVLRFCAAAAVMVYHFSTVAPLLPQAPVRMFDPGLSLPTAGSRFTWCGWVGVEIFFVISGFVIALSAEGATAGAFVRRRVLRLVPAAWICSTATAAVLLAATALPASTVLQRWGSAILFIPSSEPIDGSYWTLALETVFYTLCAVALRRRTVSLERLGIALGSVSVGFWAVQTIIPLSQPTLDSVPVRLTLLPHGCFFGLGVLLYAMRSRPAPTGFRVLAAAFFATGVCQILEQADAQKWTPDPIFYPWLPVALFAIGVAAIARADALQLRLRGALPPRIVGLLGLATYPLYLLHQTVGSAMIVALAHYGVAPAWALWATGATMVTFAIVVTLWLEPPLRRWIGGRLIPNRVPQPDIRRSASLPGG